MQRLLFSNVTAILPDRLIEDAWVLCENGKIVSISKRKPKVSAETQVVDGRGGYLSPGFIDIHVHGGAHRVPGACAAWDDDDFSDDHHGLA
jgi:N-acetylglucosamine-6-phosphate deacetylase